MSDDLFLCKTPSTIREYNVRTMKVSIEFGIRFTALQCFIISVRTILKAIFEDDFHFIQFYHWCTSVTQDLNPNNTVESRTFHRRHFFCEAFISVFQLYLVSKFRLKKFFGIFKFLKYFSVFYWL